MKQLNYRLISLAVACCALCTSMTFTAYGNTAPQRKSISTSKKIVPNKRFAKISALANYMTDADYDSMTPEGLVKYYQDMSIAIKSYWTIKYKGSNTAKMTETVMADLKKYSDKISDSDDYGVYETLVRATMINLAINSYLTAKNYNERYKDNPLYYDEMRDWNAFREELETFAYYISYINLRGGVGDREESLYATENIREYRLNNYIQLHSGGKFETCHATLQSVRSQFLQAATTIPNPEQYMDEDMEDDIYFKEEFEEKIADMQQCGKHLQELFNKWLDSNLKLCESEGVPESHTAAFVENIVQLIQINL